MKRKKRKEKKTSVVKNEFLDSGSRLEVMLGHVSIKRDYGSPFS